MLNLFTVPCFIIFLEIAIKCNSKRYKNGGKKQMIREQITDEELFNSIVKVSDVEQSSIEWVVDNWIPKGRITLLAGDGGIGKSTLWASIIAALSRGDRCLLEKPVSSQFGVRSSQNLSGKGKMRCMYFAKEDGTGDVIKAKLEKMRADDEFIITMDDNASAKLKNSVRIGSEVLDRLIDHYRPDLCIFDPVQSFLPDGANINVRADVRKCVDHLNALGSQYGTAFLITCHTNKQRNSYGRARVSNSADVWDGARSVIMAGKTGFRGMLGDYCYLSNEKNNHAPRQQSIVFVLGHNEILDAYRSELNEEEFVRLRNQNAATNAKNESQKERCKKEIAEVLKETGPISVGELHGRLADEGYKDHTIRNARTELYEEGRIVREPRTDGKKTVQYVRLVGESLQNE